MFFMAEVKALKIGRARQRCILQIGAGSKYREISKEPASRTNDLPALAVSGESD